MKNLILLLFLIPVLFCDCQMEKTYSYEKEKIWYNNALSLIDFNCAGITSDYYFHALFNNQELCYNDGIDDYEAYSAQGAGFVTDSPFLI
jgi:hypothetical protein